MKKTKAQKYMKEKRFQYRAMYVRNKNGGLLCSEVPEFLKLMRYYAKTK